MGMSSTGIAGIYAVSSTFDNPCNGTGKAIDIYSYASCVPTCGKDANGVWQAWQEVSPSGDKTLYTTGAAQFTCKYVGPNLGGTAATPTNTNKDKNTPPGN
jgi:hypothetical protein